MEHIYGWKEIEPGYWNFRKMDFYGMNKWGKPIAAVTVAKKIGGLEIKFYATPLLFSELVKKPETMIIKYDGVVQARAGHTYPRFKCIE